MSAPAVHSHCLPADMFRSPSAPASVPSPPRSSTQAALFPAPTPLSLRLSLSILHLNCRTPPPLPGRLLAPLCPLSDMSAPPPPSPAVLPVRFIRHRVTVTGRFTTRRRSSALVRACTCSSVLFTARHRSSPLVTARLVSARVSSSIPVRP